MVGIFMGKKPYKPTIIWVDKLYQRRLKLIKLLKQIKK